MTLKPVDRAAESTRLFPTDGADADKLVCLLRYAVAAPTGHTTQPWAFRVVDGTTLQVRADRSRALPVVDPEDRELPVQLPGLRHRVADPLEDGRTPQAVLRLGNATPHTKTPRRRVDDVLLTRPDLT